MDHFSKLVIAVALCCAGAVHAGYAQLTPPPGWVAGTGAAATYQAPAAAAWVNSKALADAAIASASGTSKIRVSLAVDRVAASRVLAGRIGSALAIGVGGPLTVGLTVGAALLMPEIAKWWEGTDFEWDGKQWWRKKKDGEIEYWLDFGPVRSSAQAACETAIQLGYTNPRVVESDALYCVAGKGGLDRALYIRTRGAQTVTRKPADYEQEVRPVIQDLPLPEKLPNIVWPASWPVKDPVINPDSTGKPQPLFIPTGNPVKNPNYDPSQPISATNQPYLQPGIRVVPAPAPGDPWRVDVQPVDKPVGSDDPDQNNEPDDPSNDKPQEEPSLCEKHPDILACQKLDQPEDKDLPSSEKDISITPDGGWGADNAACPAPRHLTVQGRDIPIPFDLFCTYMQGLRPIVIAMAWLSAAFILIGARESS